jgi:regulator of Ty1 transposition protein 103
LQAEELVKRLSDLEHSASSDAAVREKIAALPPEVSDVNHLAKINGKYKQIQSENFYNVAITQCFCR